VTVPSSHLQALSTRLNRDGRVQFKNGSVVTVENEGLDLKITYPNTDKYNYVNCHAYHQVERAYGYAIKPPKEET
jgi:hypothetical protein